MPSVIRAEYRGGFRIHLTFNDHSDKTVDFRQWLDGPIFEPLKAREYFRQFFVDGGTVVWPNGADIAPETLYSVPGLKGRAGKHLQPTKARRRAGRPAQARAPSEPKRRTLHPTGHRPVSA